MFDLEPELRRRQELGLYRRRRTLDSPQGPQVQVNGRSLLAFCSNDYLGLAADARVTQALQAGAGRWGTGAGAAHLLTGHQGPHQALEEELADFLGRPRALLFSTGYMANLGLVSALVGQGDQLWGDRWNHASLLDGARLSGARWHRYPHRDAAALERRLQSTQRPARRTLLITDGVFSMDGDLAPLPDLAQVAQRHQAWLAVDDAHGFGVLGPSGRGTSAHFGLGLAEVPVLMGTLGKACGTFGAFVAGSEALIETLIQQARSYIYTTAAPPALAEATRAALAILRSEDWRRERLQSLIQRFRSGASQLGLPLGESPTPVQPLLAGSAARALDWSQRLEKLGLLVPAIRPPTVPQGQARLRVSLSAAHQEPQVDQLLDSLGRTFRALSP